MDILNLTFEQALLAVTCAFGIAMFISFAGREIKIRAFEGMAMCGWGAVSCGTIYLPRPHYLGDGIIMLVMGVMIHYSSKFAMATVIEPADESIEVMDQVIEYDMSPFLDESDGIG